MANQMKETYSQWQYIDEVSLFLHDGLVRVSDLIEIPEETLKNNRNTTLVTNGVAGNGSTELEQINFDTRSPKELSDRILSVCGTRNNAYVQLVAYRVNALRGLWNQRQLAVEQEEKAEILGDDSISGLHKKQILSGLWQANDTPSFTSRLGLLLVLPLLKSQSRTDPGLRATVTQLLLQCLLDYPPHSLSKEPDDCLNSLEELLCGWLEGMNVTESSDNLSVSLAERESVASALVALVAKRGCLKSFINTLYILHNIPDIKSLPVAQILRKLLELEGASWASLAGNRHVICWGFEDMLPSVTKKDGADKDADFGRSVTCDGKFLYTTNSAGNGLAKIGSGLGGTLRGYVYTKTVEIGPGRVAWGGPGLLLHRPHDFDVSKEPNRFAVVINSHTLKQEETIYIPSSVSVKSVVTTIQFCSDGLYFYWVWCPGNIGDKSIKSQTIYVDVFTIQPGQSEVVPLKKRIVLQRKEDSGIKSVNETLMSLLRPNRPATAANLVVLSGNLGVPFVPGQDNSGAITSCGIPLKSLLRVPIYCCGNSVVIVTSSTTTGSNNIAARSPFGSAGTLANLRSLATCHFYSLKDGSLVSRTDLYDAPLCSLARGTQLSGMAACYDAINNMIWTCSSEWIDQFLNPGHQAAHHINRRLNIDEDSSFPIYPSDDRLSLPVVIKQLLQHVASLCCNQTEWQIIDPPTNRNHQMSPKETPLFVKVLDMLEMAVRSHDHQIICCNLVILQVICKSLKLREHAVDDINLNRTRKLLWPLLTSEKYGNAGDKCSRIQIEACQVFCTALSVLYSSPEDHKWIHKHLLTEGENIPALNYLRELIMSDYADRLKRINIDASELKYLILNDELLDLVMNLAVEESRRILLNCFQANPDEFEKMFLSLPYASPFVCYLCSLQNYLFRQLISGKNTDGNGVVLNDSYSNEMRQLALNISQKVLNGARKVFEVLIEICESSGREGADCKRINSIERAVKSTILGYLLPIVVTSLSHSALQQGSNLSSLIPHLIRLIILSSKIAILLKKHSQKSQQPPKLSSSHSSKNVEDVLPTILPTTDAEKLEEMGFLDALKIPAPWARGCIVESIHPVRDNYKMKETVHIPGARSLFLRFDSRCSSQYDYDKLLVYAGPDTNGHKVAEYGGNTFGYGSRSVLGGGWPKDLVKVEGDTVTFAFEMRSGREHNTPDKAMWGFLVTVRAQESLETVANGLPFVTDLALGLTVLASDILQLLYKGPPLSPEEIKSDILLKSRFIQRCVCHADSDGFNNSKVDLPIDENSEFNTVPSTSLTSGFKTTLSADFLHKLRKMSGCIAPQLRPSIRSALHVDRMEDRIMSAVLKHAHLPTNSNCLLKFQEQPECKEKFENVISQSYRKLDALIRRLQALAELEQRWQSEVEDIRQGMVPANMAFFADYHFSDSKTKELSMLCFLKGVDMEGSSAEVVVHNLREKLESEAYTKEGSNMFTVLPFAKTRQLVATILQRAEILLMVTLEGHDKATLATDELPESSDTNSLGKPAYLRSFSAPCQASDLSIDKSTINEHNIVQLPKNKRLSGLWGRYSTSILGDIPSDDDDSPSIHSVQSPNLLDQLFTIISCQPEKNISPKEFKTAVQTRKCRGIKRHQSLVYMKELLTAALSVDGATHLPSAVTSVLQNGPKTNELTCSGMITPVREAFADTVASIVKLVSHYPLACSNVIGLLCVIPYSKSEERCLVNSGLVQLLDWMCSLSVVCQDQRWNTSSDPKNLRQRVAAMAWAGFQVLSNCCVTWEKDEDLYEDEYLPIESPEHSGQLGLAQQVATLLTNHLARATDNNCDDAGGNEALQEVLSLLNNLSKSHLGKAILSQPTCVSKLLSLLLDQRPSPKLILIILQLCRSALPLMSAEDCKKVILPAWGNCSQLDNSTADTISIHIASLLLTKLADFVIPGFPMTAALEPSSAATKKTSENSTTEVFSQESAAHEGDQDGRLSVFLYKREDQSAHEVIHPLFSADNRLYRLSGTSERMERITRELNKIGRSEVCTEEAVSALRRAAKWAQSGMVVSTGPVEKDSHDGNVDRRKMTTDSICKEKNVELAKSDPLRLFISGQVANSMASEIIGLLHELLMADTASKIWASSVRNVLGDALLCLPQIMKQMDVVGVPHGNVANLLQNARCLLATLCALGGFKTSLKVGSEALVTSVLNDDTCKTYGVVVALDEHHGLATVKFKTEETGDYSSQCNERTCQVPLSRLVPIQCKQLPLDELDLTDQVIRALHSLLLYESERKPFPTVSYGSDDNLLPMTIARIGAEIRTRAFMVLSLYLKNKSFAKQFLSYSSRALEILKQFSIDCLPSDRTISTESRCERLRMLFRDCAKPPLPPIKSPSSKPKEITWNVTRGFPPVRASLFSHGLTGITYLGEPGSTPQGMPRGTFIYASQGIPLQASSFYWEIEICSLGEVLGDDNSNVFSLGLAPLPERNETPWVNQIGTVIMHNGRAVHYCGSSLLAWKSVKLECAEFAAGDIVGCGWERTENLPELLGRPPKGHIFFTYNGQLVNGQSGHPYIEDVVGGMYPVVHLQKKGVRIKANFGTRPFAYAEGLHHVTSAHEALESTEEIIAAFGLLPFPCCSDSESEGSDKAGPANDAGNENNVCASGATDKALKSSLNASASSCKVSTIIDKTLTRDYDYEASLHAHLAPCYSNVLTTGPEPYPVTGLVEGEDSTYEEQLQQMQMEDQYALLVKNWEIKVFPVIRRRFRNEGERKDGLEQIRGALSLGMTDIARQTVEYLYEENGGIPRDLHLPTIEDIKEEMSRISLDRIKKGQEVVLRNPVANSAANTGVTMLPKFAVPGMLKTFGLLAVVLDIDQNNELVQLEIYLRSEGVLVRYWYPIDMLERPPTGMNRSSINSTNQLIDTNNAAVHRELIYWENALSRVYCRVAFLELTDTLKCNLIADEVIRLQLLSNDRLASSCFNGTIFDRSLDTCVSSISALKADSCCVSDLFYPDVVHMQSELRKVIEGAVSEEDRLLEMTNRITTCLQLQREAVFRCEQVQMLPSKAVSDIQMSEAAFIVVFGKVDPEKNSPKNNAYSCSKPWGRVFYYSGQDFKRYSSTARQEVAYYPYGPLTTQSGAASNNVSGNSLFYPFPTAILSCDRVHLRVGGYGCADVYVMVNSIPANFPLAIAFIEELLRWPCKTSSVKTFSVVSRIVDILCNFIAKVDLPFRLKECIFHLLAEALRCLLDSEEDLSTVDYPSLTLLSLLQMELKLLHDDESRHYNSYWLDRSTKGGVVDRSIRFSSYFHSVMEVCLAMAEIANHSSSRPFRNAGAASLGLYGICEAVMALSSGSGGSGVVGSQLGCGAAPPSPSAGSKRKKMKAKRDRDRASPKSRSGSNSPRSSVCENEPQASTSTIATVGTAKAEELLWFHRAVNACEILRVVVDGKKKKSPGPMDDAIIDSFQTLNTNTAAERILIITGIPTHLSENEVKRAIEKALRSVGGPQRGEIFVATTSMKIEQPSTHTHSTSTLEMCTIDKPIYGFAAVEIKVKAKIEAAKKALFRCKGLLDGSSLELGLMTEEVIDLADNNISISTVKENLQLSDPDDNYAFETYLKYLLYRDNDFSELRDAVVEVLTDIFNSCFITDQHLAVRDVKEESGIICLSKEQITNQAQGNLLHTFFTAVHPAKKSIFDNILSLLSSYGFSKKENKESPTSEKPLADTKLKPKKSSLKKSNKEKFLFVCQNDPKYDAKDEKNKLEKTDHEVEERFYLTLDGFLKYVSGKGQKDIQGVWRGLLACSYDFHYDRTCCVDLNQAQYMTSQWTLEMDCALVKHVDTLCRKFVISPSQLHPHEIYLSASDLSSVENVCLQGLPVESLRLRTAFLQSLNTALECNFLPFVELRMAEGYSHSMVQLLSRARGIVFHDTKIVLMNHVLNTTALRRADQAAPEIILDLLEVIGSENQKMSNTQFCQAMLKLSEISSSQFCVQLASGGDPTYSFNVRYVGEEVHGTSGSFRHFLSQVSRELQSTALPLLVPCPSAAANRNKGKFVLLPGALSFSDEKMLQFFGQLLGITIRAGIPLPIDLVPAFWKQMVGVPLDPIADLQDVDVLTYNYIKEFDLVENVRSLSQLLEEHHNPHFVYTNLNGDKVDLCPDGQNIPVSWENRLDYVHAIRSLRMKELTSSDRYVAIKAGLASIIPIQLLNLLTPLDLELRTCGVPYVDLDFLKNHTMYQVGLTETDPHIRFFWNALESLSQEELRKFIKFACNQERIPSSCPCKDGHQDAMHVPPYPMKIAPPEGRSGTPDSRYIRAETCMFMLKLPQYSAQEIMTERLLYAINCRDDPLSG